MRRRPGNDKRRDSSVEEAFANTNLHCGNQVDSQENQATWFRVWAWHQSYRPERCHHKERTHFLQTENIGGLSPGKETVRTTTGGITWPSTQENHVAIRVRKRDTSRMPPDAMRPPSCSASESYECGKLFRRPCAGVRGSLFSPTCLSCLVAPHHPLTAHRLHTVQGHRPAFPKRVLFFT